MKQLVIYKLGETNIQTTIDKNGYADFTDGKLAEAYLDKLGHGYAIMPFDQALDLITKAENEKYLDKPWKEIDEDMWEKWLSVLPPEKWQTVEGVEIFRLAEYLISNITMHCAKYNNRYFQSNRRTVEPCEFMAAQIKIICNQGGLKC